MAACDEPGHRFHGSTVPLRLRALVHAPKADVTIRLDSEQRIYTTLDRLEGEVCITTFTDTSFDDVSIELFGSAYTYVDRITTATGTPKFGSGSHHFLRLIQPDLQQFYPQDRVFKSL